MYSKPQNQSCIFQIRRIQYVACNTFFSTRQCELFIGYSLLSFLSVWLCKLSSLSIHIDVNVPRFYLLLVCTQISESTCVFFSNSFWNHLCNKEKQWFELNKFSNNRFYLHRQIIKCTVCDVIVLFKKKMIHSPHRFHSPKNNGIYVRRNQIDKTLKGSMETKGKHIIQRT